MFRCLITPVLLVAVLLATSACSSDPAPTPPPTGTPAPTSSATGGPAPSASASPPSASVTPPSSPTPSPPADLAWTAVPLPGADTYSTLGVFDVAVLDGVFLAVGTGWQEDSAGVEVNVPLFWRSPDGRQWQLLDAAWPDEGYIDVLSTWQGEWLAAGYVGDERASAAFWTSPDGVEWRRLPDQPVLQFYRGATEGRDIVAGGISYVRGDGEELIARGWLYCACATHIRDAAVEWRTTDGREWQRAELPPGQDVAPPAEGGAGLLRIAESGSAIELSPDGDTWQVVWAPAAAAPDDDPTAQLFALGQWPGGLLAVGVVFQEGVGRPLVLTSATGETWAMSSGTAFDDLDAAIVDFAAGPLTLVAVGRVGDPPAPFVWVGAND